MSTKTKFFLTYIGGIITGVLLVFTYAYYQESTSAEAVYFEHPQQVIEAKIIRVFQVYPDGSALAMIDDSGSYGTVLALPGTKNSSYYDNQKITIPSDKCVKQIGTFRYTTNSGSEKVVPIVDLYDK